MNWKSGLDRVLTRIQAAPLGKDRYGRKDLAPALARGEWGIVILSACIGSFSTWFRIRGWDPAIALICAITIGFVVEYLSIVTMMEGSDHPYKKLSKLAQRQSRPLAVAVLSPIALTLLLALSHTLIASPAHLYYGAGRIYQAIGAHDGALRAYGRALEIDSDFVPAWFGHIFINQQQGSPYEAARDWSAFLDRASQSPKWAEKGRQQLSELVLYDLVDEFVYQNPPSNGQNHLEEQVWTVDGVQHRVLFQHPPSQTSLHLDIESPVVLYFGIVMDPAVQIEGQSDGVLFQITVRAQGTEQVVFSKFFDPAHNVQDRSAQEQAIDLSGFGPEIDLTFSTHPGPSDDSSYDWAGWSRPMLITSAEQP